MKTALVTGAAGFIGSHVAEHLVRRGHRVVGIDDLSGGFVENVPPGVDFRVGSIEDEAFLDRLWQEQRIDLVYHLAAYAAEGLSHFIRRFNYRNNVLGSVNLINRAVRGECEGFVFTSSIAVYGAGQTPMVETTTPQPEDPYGIAKLAVELDLKAAHHMFGLPFVVFRPHNVYGPRQNVADPYRNVIGIFMNQALQGRPMTIFGDGSQTRAFSYVDDVAIPIAESPFVRGALQETFNVGADAPYSVSSLAHAVGEALGLQTRVEHLPPRKEVLHAFASHAKAEAVFGRRDAVPLDEGLRRMAEWVRQRRPQQGVAFSGIEIMKNLPPSWARLSGVQS